MDENDLKSSEQSTATSSQTDSASKKYLSKKELLVYGVAAGGQGMIYAIMSSYISEFYLNVAMLPAVFVFLLMLLARVWDAINDPMMGMIADRCSSKLGKFKPYVLFTPIPVAILTFLMFYKPESFNQTQLMIYASVTYVLWGMIYTVSDVPFWSLPNAMTPNEKERASTISFGKTINGIGSAIPMVLYLVLGFALPYMTTKSGVEFDKLQYMIIALFCAIVGGAIFVTCFFTTKERVIMPKKLKTERSGGTLKRLFTCKPLMLVVLMGVLASGRYLVQAGAIHVARYSFYVGPSLVGLSQEAVTAAISSSRTTVSTVFTACSAVGMFGAMLMMPFFYKRYNYKQIVITTCILGFFSSALMMVMGWFVSFWACIPFIIISSIPLGVLNITSYVMIGDCLDYMEWKTGHRETGLGSACQSFVNKLGNAVATALIVLVYIGFAIDPAKIVADAGSINPTVVSNEIRFGMFALVSLAPGISMLLCAIPVLFYDIVGDKKKMIMEELAKQRVERGVIINDK